MARGRDALRKGVITNQQHNSNNGLATQPNSQCPRPKGGLEARMTLADFRITGLQGRLRKEVIPESVLSVQG